MTADTQLCTHIFTHSWGICRARGVSMQAWGYLLCAEGSLAGAYLCSLSGHLGLRDLCVFGTAAVAITPGPLCFCESHTITQYSQCITLHQYQHCIGAEATNIGERYHVICALMHFLYKMLILNRLVFYCINQSHVRTDRASLHLYP